MVFSASAGQMHWDKSACLDASVSPITVWFWYMLGLSGGVPVGLGFQQGGSVAASERLAGQARSSLADAFGIEFMAALRKP
jgi:hypothetical protein